VAEKKSIEVQINPDTMGIIVETIIDHCEVGAGVAESLAREIFSILKLPTE